MNLIPTELNKQLSEAVLNRIASDKSHIAGQTGFWRLVGLGLVGLGIGAGTGVGLYGYAQITRNTDNVATLSSAFSKALSEIQLNATAEGVVRLEPRELFLAKGQTISLDKDSRVRLDRSASVLADGELRVQAPSISAPQANQQRAQAASTIANFTVFKRVVFEKGTVMTGWKFLTSTQKSPTSQYCYYTENADGPSGLDVVLTIANDEKFEPPKTIPKDFDTAAAFSKCVWFKSTNP